MTTEPVAVAPDTFLLPGPGGSGSLLIAGAQPVLVDPTTAVPADLSGRVRWIFLSGPAARERAPLDRWPGATVVTTAAIARSVDSHAVRTIGDGGWFEVGDRDLLALRSPFSGGLGLLDLSTGVFWAPGHGLASTVDPSASAQDAWRAAERIGTALERLRAVRPSAVVSASGPVVRGAEIDRAMAALAAAPFLGAEPQPDPEPALALAA